MDGEGAQENDKEGGSERIAREGSGGKRRRGGHKLGQIRLFLLLSLLLPPISSSLVERIPFPPSFQAGDLAKNHAERGRKGRRGNTSEQCTRGGSPFLATSDVCLSLLRLSPSSDLLLLYSHLKLRREAEREGKMERGPLALFNKQDLAIFLFPAASPNATLAYDIAELVFRVAKKNGE